MTLFFTADHSTLHYPDTNPREGVRGRPFFHCPLILTPFCSHPSRLAVPQERSLSKVVSLRNNTRKSRGGAGKETQRESAGFQCGKWNPKHFRGSQQVSRTPLEMGNGHRGQSWVFILQRLLFPPLLLKKDRIKTPEFPVLFVSEEENRDGTSIACIICSKKRIQKFSNFAEGLNLKDTCRLGKIIFFNPDIFHRNRHFHELLKLSSSLYCTNIHFRL